jgi:glycosyltransferase involved in cell wall biosynthesis
MNWLPKLGPLAHRVKREFMSLQPIVRVVPFQPHCFAFGGFEVQMITAMEAARAAGADIAPLDFWGCEADFDVLHLWGLELQHSNTVKWAHAANKKIVISALTNYPGWRSSLRHLFSFAMGPARLRKPMLAQLDCITVVNSEQKKYLINTLGFPTEKVFVIPNVIDDIYFAGKEEVDDDFEIENYVICTGNICPRKNQLALVRACRKIGVPLLLVGNVLTGEEDYGRAVAEAITSHSGVRWVKGWPPGSAELAAAYRRSAVFALPSYSEQQPISALEAAASRKPLILGARPYAKQEFYEHALLVNPHSVEAIAAALRKALDRPEAYCPPAATLERCRHDKVGSAYLAIYKQLAYDSGSLASDRSLQATGPLESN